tara:strand:- start:655 stop:1464 length:810 start_codon:yes stop_codon:yes gene_type:complete
MSGQLICGKTTTGSVSAVKISNTGHLLVDTNGDGDTTVKCMGSEDGTTTGTQNQIHVDGSGNLLVKEVGTVNVAPADSVNSGTQNDPTNSVAVGLRARTTITDATTETFLKCDASGVLSVSSSGGSGNSNAYPTLGSITTATNFGGGMVQSAYIDLSNAKNIIVNCIHTGNNTARTNFASDISFTMEFTDDDTNTVCYSGASTPSVATSTLDAIGNSTGDAVAVLNLGESKNAQGEITGKFGRVVAVNNDASGTGTAYAVSFKVVISGI